MKLLFHVLNFFVRRVIYRHKIFSMPNKFCGVCGITHGEKLFITRSLSPKVMKELKEFYPENNLDCDKQICREKYQVWKSFYYNSKSYDWNKIVEMESDALRTGVFSKLITFLF